MIQNKHQYKVTNSKLKELEQSLADLAHNPNGLSPRLWQAEKAGVQVWIDRLQVEIAEYDRLQQGESVFKISSLTELPIALIKARIARGMTQKELAERIGVKEQQIQRYEANHYDSASFDRLNEVYTALGISFKESEVVMQITVPLSEAQPPIHYRNLFTRYCQAVGEDRPVVRMLEGSILRRRGFTNGLTVSSESISIMNWWLCF